MLPEILPATSSQLLLPPAVAEALNWDEKKLRKLAREATERKPERDAEGGKQIDTVGDREWVRGQNLKGKEKGGRKCSPPQYLLFPFLLFSVFFFTTSHFYPPCWGSPSSSRVFLPSFCFPLLQTVHNSTFDPVLEQQLLQAHMCAGRNNKVSQAGTMNRVRRKERLYQQGRGWRGGGVHKTKTVKWDNVKKSEAERLVVILKATPDNSSECGLGVQQEAG